VANPGNWLYFLLLKLFLSTVKVFTTEMDKSLSTGMPLPSVAVIPISIFSLSENFLEY
jgi:hypothetical protein